MKRSPLGPSRRRLAEAGEAEGISSKYASRNTQKMDLDRDIEQYDLAFLDLETTGLNVVMGDSICEIGAYKVRNRKIIDKFHSLVNPKRKIPLEAQRVHKISDADVQYAPFFEKLADKLISFLKDSVVCAYNVSFDMGFIDHQLKSIECPALNTPAIDILTMARDTLKLSRYNLQTVAQSLDIDCSNGLHRALDDSLVAYQVFSRLINVFKEKGISKLDEFISLYGFGNEIFKSKEAQRMNMINEAIEKEQALYIKYFSSDSRVEEEKVIPLRIFQENRFFCLTYQGANKSSARVSSNRILKIEASE